MNLLFTVIGRKFKFQAQDSYLEYFFLEIERFEKRIALSEKKPPLTLGPLGSLDVLYIDSLKLHK